LHYNARGTVLEDVPARSGAAGVHTEAGRRQRQIDQEKVRIATEEWRRSSQYPGEGNDRFFAYALALRTAGMSDFDIENKLIAEARYGRSPNERRAQIPSIVTSLKQS
jgi:hypothetical protein